MVLSNSDTLSASVATGSHIPARHPVHGRPNRHWYYKELGLYDIIKRSFNWWFDGQDGGRR
jgi:hypothetical protein